MAKNTQYTDTKNEMVVITFNREKQTEQGTKYIPAVVEVRVDAITSEGASYGVKKEVEVGTLQDTPLTLKQIYNAVNKTTTGATISGVIKQAFIEAVATDPSI